MSTILDDARDLAALAADIKYEHRYDIRVELCQKSRGVEYWHAYEDQRFDVDGDSEGDYPNYACALAHDKWTAVRDLIDKLEDAERKERE